MLIPAAEAETVTDDLATGGDAACWLHLVCERCGAIVEGAAHECPDDAPDPATRQVPSSASGRSEVAAGDERRIAQVE